MGLANDLIIIFLGLEILSIALYVLTAFNHRRAASGEAALKYFILGGFSSAIFVYGIALTYGATGSTNLTQIADFLSKNVVLTNGLLLAGLALMLVGFAFKIAAVPFHMWTPDVYQGAPTPVTGFMAAVAKAGAFAALLRVLVLLPRRHLRRLAADHLRLAVLSLARRVRGGAAPARRQAHAGLLVDQPRRVHPARRGVGTARGVSASLYYLVAYTFMTIGSFAIVTVLGREGDGDHDLTRYRGLARRQPLLALCFAILLLAQAGAPFTTGLVGQAAGRPGVGLGRRGAARRDRHGDRGHRRLLLPAGGRAHVRLDGTGGRVDEGFVAAAARTDAAGRQIPWASPDGVSATITTLNAELLLADDAPAATGEETPSVVPVPLLTAVAIGICVGVTVIFGIVPAPLLDFANHATLLFFGR